MGDDVEVEDIHVGTVVLLYLPVPVSASAASRMFARIVSKGLFAPSITPLYAYDCEPLSTDVSQRIDRMRT